MNDKKSQLLEARLANLESCYASLEETMGKMVTAHFEMVLVLHQAVPVDKWPQQLRAFHEQAVAALARAKIDIWR